MSANLIASMIGQIGAEIHSSEACGLIGCQVGSTAPFHFRSKVPHRLLRDDLTFAAGNRGFRIVERYQEFRPLALTLFPKRQCFLHRIFGAAKSASLNGAADKGFLIGS